MEIIDSLFTIYYFGGIALFLSGIVMYIFPPKRRNLLYGYRTSRSAKSQSAWDFSQRFSSKRLIGSGLALLAFGGLLNLINIPEEYAVIVMLSLMIVAAVYIFYATEKALKTKFPD